MDKISRESRSANMAAIRGKDTALEMLVRRFLHREGLRYRLHAAQLPGKPDLIFPSRRAVLFVHGCFWHGCPSCAVGRRKVKSNTTYWESKIARNKARDARSRAELEAAGWKVFTIWACEIPNKTTLNGLAKSIRRQRSPSSGSSPRTNSSVGP
jgi:DNA mismatch endonuclease (patch repair protein)